VDHRGGVERGVAERQRQRARQLEHGAIGKTAAARQIVGHVDELLGQVDAGHPAAARFREIAARPAQAGADVEHVHAGREPERLASSMVAGSQPRCSSSAAERSAVVSFSMFFPLAARPSRMVRSMSPRV
jgi:hypothetical protein